MEDDDQDKMKTQLKSMELELESYKEACSAESRDKADLITAERKARVQVWWALLIKMGGDDVD